MQGEVAMKQTVLVWRAKDHMVFTRENAKAEAQKKMMIPGQYKKIDDDAFKNNIKIRNVILDHNITEIGCSSFLNCTGMRSIRMEGIQLLRKSAFQGCVNLSSIELPETLRYIGKNAFSSCKRLRRISVHPGSCCDRILKETFSECINLEEVTLPERIVRIEDRAFYRCMALERIKLPENLQEIGRSSFYQCGLTEIEFPEKLEKIGDSAFLKCRRLEYVKIPPHVRIIEKWAFHGCDRLKVLEIVHDPEELGEWIINRSARIRCRRGSKVDAYCREKGFQTEYIS